MSINVYFCLKLSSWLCSKILYVHVCIYTHTNTHRYTHMHSIQHISRALLGCWPSIFFLVYEKSHNDSFTFFSRIGLTPCISLILRKTKIFFNIYSLAICINISFLVKCVHVHIRFFFSFISKSYFCINVRNPLSIIHITHIISHLIWGKN